MSHAFTSRLATLADAPAVVALVNAAYRGEAKSASWTAETEIISGARLEDAGFRDLVDPPRSVVLLLEREGRIVGCVHLGSAAEGECFFSMLSVLPHEQSGGVGRHLLAQAESYARERMGARMMAMTVVRERVELVAWYVRRGYHRTGEVVPFEPPPSQRLLRGPLHLERLEKRLVGA